MDISFSVRLENIVDITNLLLARGKDPLEAREEARILEDKILKDSHSEEAYQKSCSELLKAVHDPRPAATEAAPIDEILNPEGPTFGSYSCATFHRDGQTSTVYKAKANSASTSTPSIVALKVTLPSRLQPPHNVQREARILAQARHPHVVPLLQSFWQSDSFILVFPFLRQDLENLLRSGSLTRSQTSIVFRGLFSALSYIHSLNIIHRDVKPSNILLREMDGPVYLADFGIAWSAEDPESEKPDAKITDVGTTSYRPPELLFGDRSYDTSLDMWAAGCVVSEMIRNDHLPLFDAGPLGSELGLIKSIFSTLGTPSESTWPSVTKLPDWGKVQFKEFPAQDLGKLLKGASPEALDFIRCAVCYEGSARLTASQALKHPLATQLQIEG